MDGSAIDFLAGFKAVIKEFENPITFIVLTVS